MHKTGFMFRNQVTHYEHKRNRGDIVSMRDSYPEWIKQYTTLGWNMFINMKHGYLKIWLLEKYGMILLEILRKTCQKNYLALVIAPFYLTIVLRYLDFLKIGFCFFEVQNQTKTQTTIAK